MLHAVEQRGELVVAREVRAALASGEALQLAVRARQPKTSVPVEALPSILARIEVQSDSAGDYDALLGGVQ